MKAPITLGTLQADIDALCAQLPYNEAQAVRAQLAKRSPERAAKYVKILALFIQLDPADQAALLAKVHREVTKPQLRVLRGGKGADHA